MADERQRSRPAQRQDRQTGIEPARTPEPSYEPPEYRATGKLDGKEALVTGGDSGIGRSMAALYGFLAPSVASYGTGRTVHPNGGGPVGG